MAKNKKNHYVNNKKFLEVLTEYHIGYFKQINDGIKKPTIRIPEYVGECVLSIATNLAKKPNFSGYDFKEEMIYDGIENCLVYVHKFDPEKSSNPFAYFTQIIYFAFLRRIEKEKKKLYIQIKMQEKLSIELSNNPEYEKMRGESEGEGTFLTGMNDFVEKFEERNFTSKKKNIKPNNPLAIYIHENSDSN